MGNVKTPVGSTLHGTENSRASGGLLQTNVEESLEWTPGLFVDLDLLCQFKFTISLSDTLKVLVKAKLNKGATGQEKTGSVCSSPVGKTVLNSVAGELVSVGGAENLISGNLGVDDLGDDL